MFYVILLLMNIIKRHILNLLFIVCFFVYVLSPLCYVGDQLYENDSIAYKLHIDLNRITTVWELLISKNSDNENSEDNQTNAKLLITKKQAIIKSNHLENRNQTKSFLLINEANVLYAESFLYLNQLSSISSENGYHTSLSWRSPPPLFFS